MHVFTGRQTDLAGDFGTPARQRGSAGNPGGMLRPSGGRERVRGQEDLQGAEPEEDHEHAHERDPRRHSQTNSAGTKKTYFFRTF